MTTETVFAALLRKARPGISVQQAYANGMAFATELYLTDGMTITDYNDWRNAHAGLALVVFLTADGTASGCKLLPRADADALVAARPGIAVVVAFWGIAEAAGYAQKGGPR